MMQYRKWAKGCQPHRMAAAVNLDRDLLPGRCVLCARRSGAAALCRPCLLGLPRIRRACPGCSLPLGNPIDSLCGACAMRPRPWLRACAALAYGFPVNRLVHLFKFRRNLAAGRALAEAMVNSASEAQFADSWLVPVPLHWRRYLVRGYDQASLLSRELARRGPWRLCGDLLRRRRPTSPQTGLEAAARRRNLRGAFSVRRDPGEIERIVLVDDVLTTGATCGECARLLVKAGAKRVDVWVAARAVLGPWFD